MFWKTKRDGRKVVNKLLTAPTHIDSGILAVFYLRLFQQKYKLCLKAWARQIKVSFEPSSKQFGCKPVVIINPYGHINSVTALC